MAQGSLRGCKKQKYKEVPQNMAAMEKSRS